jgi:hypothetical protein
MRCERSGSAGHQSRGGKSGGSLPPTDKRALFVPFVVTGIPQDGDNTTSRPSNAAGLLHEALDLITPEESDRPIAAAVSGPHIIIRGGLETGAGVPGNSPAFRAPRVPSAFPVETYLRTCSATRCGTGLQTLPFPMTKPSTTLRRSKLLAVSLSHGTAATAALIENVFATAA